MVHTAYLIITPDPGQDHYIQEVSHDGCHSKHYTDTHSQPDGHYFYVKFGDGPDNLSHYKRANPNFGYSRQAYGMNPI